MKRRNISLLVVLTLSLIYFLLKDDFKIDKTNIEFSEMELSDSTNFLIERWHVHSGIFSRDTFPNCRYNYIDSVAIIVFDSSTTWNSSIQLEISENRKGLFYRKKNNGIGWISIDNKIQFEEKFSILVELQDVINQKEQIMIDLDYRYNIYSLPIFKKQRWYHKINPAFGTERTPYLIKGRCLCQKTNEELKSKSEEFNLGY